MSLESIHRCKVRTGGWVQRPQNPSQAFTDEYNHPSSGLPGTNLMERYPLVVAVTDGRVQRVCSHPDDDTWSINMKKGVASALQNSLPSLSITNSGLTFTEVCTLTEVSVMPVKLLH